MDIAVIPQAKYTEVLFFNEALTKINLFDQLIQQCQNVSFIVRKALLLEHNLLYVENQIVMHTFHKRCVTGLPNDCITLFGEVVRQMRGNMCNCILYHIHIQDITIFCKYIIQNHF